MRIDAHEKTLLFVKNKSEDQFTKTLLYSFFITQFKLSANLGTKPKCYHETAELKHHPVSLNLILMFAELRV